jgi:hypothetical protein
MARRDDRRSGDVVDCPTRSNARSPNKQPHELLLDPPGLGAEVVLPGHLVAARSDQAGEDQEPQNCGEKLGELSLRQVAVDGGLAGCFGGEIVIGEEQDPRRRRSVFELGRGLETDDLAGYESGPGPPSQAGGARGRRKRVER